MSIDAKRVFGDVVALAAGTKMTATTTAQRSGRSVRGLNPPAPEPERARSSQPNLTKGSDETGAVRVASSTRELSAEQRLG
jgi:hypothetical protein